MSGRVMAAAGGLNRNFALTAKGERLMATPEERRDLYERQKEQIEAAYEAKMEALGILYPEFVNGAGMGAPPTEIKPRTAKAKKGGRLKKGEEEVVPRLHQCVKCENRFPKGEFKITKNDDGEREVRCNACIKE
jgi:hypothetical protein